MRILVKRVCPHLVRLRFNTMSGGVILRRQGWLVVVLGFSMLSEAYAAFGGLVPLTYSGRVIYSYNYTENVGTQAEATNLLLALNASGYVWRPWFATTSMALNAGLSSVNSTASRSEGTVGSGSFSLGLFPRSRFPFSMSYSRTDSRSEQFQDISQISDSTSFRSTRLTLRQSYRPRAYHQLYKGWYTSTEYNGGFFDSSSKNYGLDYQLRVPQQTLTASISRSSSKSRGAAPESSLSAVSVGHVYTPSVELGVNSLASYVEADPGGNSAASTNSQAFSSFFWRPEYRALNISGGARLSESKTSAAAVARSLSTNLGLGYRISRALNMSAGVSVSASDGGGSQTLSTAQTVGLSYAGGRKQWDGFSYSWQWNGSAANLMTKREAPEGTQPTESSQNISSGIGHGLNKSWSAGSGGVAASLSQSASASKSSEADSMTSSMNHGVSLSWNSRGKRGSTYVSGRFNDSRSFGDQETVFDSFSLNYNTSVSFNRLSSMSGNANYQATRSTTKGAEGDRTDSSSRNLTGGMSYRNNRPFGIYNLHFTTSLRGSKQINSVTPTSIVYWEGQFGYSLGLLSTSLSFRASESATGSRVKSMNFQATRAF